MWQHSVLEHIVMPRIHPRPNWSAFDPNTTHATSHGDFNAFDMQAATKWHQRRGFSEGQCIT
jgi:hypothetical protein